MGHPRLVGIKDSENNAKRHLELLEQLLQEYEGTLFLVSHDRTFLDNVVTQTIAAEGEGAWKEYAGGYSDWANYKAGLDKAPAAASRKPESKAAAKSAEPVREKGAKLSWKESRELEALPQQIADLENEQGGLTQTLEDPAIYQQDPKAAEQAAKRLAEIDELLMSLLERWEVLESKAAAAG